MRNPLATAAGIEPDPQTAAQMVTRFRTDHAQRAVDFDLFIPADGGIEETQRGGGGGRRGKRRINFGLISFWLFY